jgi:serine/threonine protein kinase
MGEIFLARERGTDRFDRLVVVKRLLADPDEHPDQLRLFLDEARIAANLAHPNIVATHELGHDGDEYFLAMEFVPNQNLGRVLGRVARLGSVVPLPIAGLILIESARGLAYAHQARDADGQDLAIVHRDVSPSNILIGYRGEVKVADFGIAKANNRASHTRTGHLRGKFPYMSPEQLRSGHVDARSDVWSLGGRRLGDPHGAAAV